MKKRIEWLDIAKGIAILLMILGHNKLFASTFIFFIFSFHMPLFFLASGYTSRLQNNWKDYCFKLCRQLLLPYFVTCMLLGIYWIVFRCYSHHEFAIPSDLQWLFRASLAAAGTKPSPDSTLPVIGSIWFLPCMFVTKLLFQMILSLTQKKRQWVQTVVILMISCLGAFIGQYVFLPFGIDVAMFCCGFLYIGYCMKSVPWKTKYALLFLPGIPVWILAIRHNGIELAARMYYAFPLCILGACIGSFFVFWISSLLCRIRFVTSIFSFLGKHSLYLLCIHKLDTQIVPWEQIVPFLPWQTHSQIVALELSALRILWTVLCLLLFLWIRALLQKHFIKHHNTPAGSN